MEIKKLKGSMSVSDFADGLLSQNDSETFGEVWENYVDCNHCRYAKDCKAITDYYEDKGINLYCSQVIDYLMGDLDPETLPKEVE